MYVVRIGRPDVFCEKDVLRNFAKFTGKHLCQSTYITLKVDTNLKETLRNEIMQLALDNLTNCKVENRTPYKPLLRHSMS